MRHDSAVRTPGSESPASALASRGEAPGKAVGRHRMRKALFGLLALLCVALTLPMAVAAVPMLQGRDALEEARASLSAGDLAAATPHLQQAERRFRVARFALRNPLSWLGGVVPGLGHTQRTAAELALAGQLVARGGAHVAEAVSELPGGVPALAPADGVLPVEAIRSLEPPLAAAASDAARAQDALAAAPHALVLSPVTAARAELEAELAGLVPGLRAAHALTETLPGFLGADGPRRYFVGASQIAELRGSGGFLGAYSIMTADAGRLSFDDFNTIHALPNAPPGAVTPPTADIEARYERFGGVERWNNVGISADFPAVGALITDLYAATGGEELDGVIVVDPFALAELLRVAGPTTVPGYGPVDHDNVVHFVANGAFAHFDTQWERQHSLGTVATAALKGFLEQGGDRALTSDSLAGLGRAARGGHLRIYATRLAEQTGFEVAGVAGALTPELGDLVDLSLNSSSNAKVDYFLETSLDYRVQLLADGGARGHVTAWFTNAAPTDGQPSYVIGPARPGFEAGDNRFFATFACAVDCTIEGFSRDGQADRRIALDRERGHELLTTPVELASGATQHLEAIWDAPSGTWAASRRGLTYRLTLRTPPSAVPTDVTVGVAVPEGMRVARAAGMGQHGDEVVFEGPVRGTKTLEVTFARQRTLQTLSGFVRQLLSGLGTGV